MQLVTPDIGLLFWMLLSFGILLFLLKKFAWKPILKVLEDRDTTIAKSLNSAKEAREEMKKLAEDNKKVLAEARKERDEMLKDAKVTKDRIIRESEDEAKVRANKIIADAQVAIESQKQKALDDVKEKVAELSISIAEKILKNELEDENKQTKYIDSLIKDVKLN